MISEQKAQKGFSAIIVIVLIVLFALLGGYMATFTSVSAINTAGSAGSIQAWFAARSAVESAIFEVLSGNCASITSPLNFSGGGLTGFQATINCSETAGVTEGPDTYSIFNIGVTATRGTPGQETFVSRSVVVTVTDRNAP